MHIPLSTEGCDNNNFVGTFKCSSLEIDCCWIQNQCGYMLLIISGVPFEIIINIDIITVRPWSYEGCNVLMKAKEGWRVPIPSRPGPGQRRVWNGLIYIGVGLPYLLKAGLNLFYFKTHYKPSYRFCHQNCPKTTMFELLRQKNLFFTFSPGQWVLASSPGAV